MECCFLFKYEVQSLDLVFIVLLILAWEGANLTFCCGSLLVDTING